MNLAVPLKSDPLDVISFDRETVFLKPLARFRQSTKATVDIFPHTTVATILVDDERNEMCVLVGDGVVYAFILGIKHIVMIHFDDVTTETRFAKPPTGPGVDFKCDFVGHFGPLRTLSCDGRKSTNNHRLDFGGQVVHKLILGLISTCQVGSKNNPELAYDTVLKGFAALVQKSLLRTP
jgi:hypothetical protein